MTLTLIKEKFSKAIVVARTLSELDYIKEKLGVTSQINRRTKVGQELTKELRWEIEDKGRLLITNGELPF